MASFLNNVFFTPQSVGTGDFVVGSAVIGYQTPALAGAVNGATYRYKAESPDKTQWEIGYGTYSTATATLARTTVLYNSSGTGSGSGQSGAGSKIDFTGLPRVGLVMLADDFQPLDSDLTDIAALTTAAYGRSLLTLASASALAAEVDSFFLTPAEGNAAYQPLDADLTAIAALTTTSYGRSLLTNASATSLAATLLPLVPDGSVGAPGLAFADDPDTGLYRIGANNIGVAVGGTKLVDLAAGVLALVGVATITPSAALADGGKAFTVTATQPAIPSATQNAIDFQITGAGSASQTNRAFNVDYLAGYTGSSLTAAGRFGNASLGTGTTAIPASGSNTIAGNQAVSGVASGIGSGYNFGVVGQAQSGAVSIGVLGLAQLAKNSATNIGGAFSAINTGTSPVHVGLWVSLNQTTVPSASAALIVDNGSQTDPIVRFRDGGTDVVTIADGGLLTTKSILGIGNSISEPQWEFYTDDDTNQPNLTVKSYGASIPGGAIHVSRARGSRSSPSAVLSGDITGGMGSRPYNGSAFVSSSPAAWHFVAAENFAASTNYGMYQRWLTTPIASATRVERMLLLDWGGLWVHGPTGTWDPLSTTQTRPFGSSGGGQMIVSGSTTDGNASFIAVNYGTGGSAGFRGGVAGGTPSSPSATTINSLLSFMGGHGHDGTNWTAGTKALLTFKAGSLWSGTNNETFVTIETVPNGSTTRAENFRVYGSGCVHIGQSATDHGANNLKVQGGIGTAAPVTKTGTSGTISATECSVIFNPSGTYTATLPAASSYAGKWIFVRTIAAQAVNSASSNVVPLAGGAAGTAILAATAGKWAWLQSDGTNWEMMAAA